MNATNHQRSPFAAPPLCSSFSTTSLLRGRFYARRGWVSAAQFFHTIAGAFWPD